MAQILTKADIADLALGNASITLLDVPANGEVTFSALDFSAGDQIYTLKESLAITQDSGEETEIKLDQHNETIYSKYDPSKISLEGNYPAVQGEDPMGFFFEEGAAATGVVGPDGKTYAGKGYDTFKQKEVIKIALVQSESGKTAFIIARLQLFADFVPVENTDTPGYLRLHGTSLPNLKANEGNICILKQTA